MADDAYYRQQFFGESREMLDSVSDALLRIEANPGDAEALHAIFRSIHTIKGSAGIFSLTELSAFAHHMESVLNKACENIIAVTPELIDLFFQGVDTLNAMLDDCQHGKTPTEDSALVARFDAVAEGLDGPAAPAAPAAPEKTEAPAQQKDGHTVLPLALEQIPDGLRGLLRSKAAQGMAVFRIKLQFSAEMLENGYDPAILLKNLRGMSRLWAAFTTVEDVTLQDFQPLGWYLDVVVYMACTATVEELKDQAFDPDLIEVVELAENAAGDLDQELLKDFLLESSGLIEQMERSVLAYEKDNSPDALNSLFRAVHTIKGDASYVGLKRLGTFAHELETQLDALRNGKVQPSPSLLDGILAHTDAIKQAMLRIQAGELDPELSTPEPTVTKEENKDALSPEVSMVFLNQVNQHRHVLETLCGSAAPQTHDDIERVTRVSQGLISAAKFVGLDELTVLADKLQNSVKQADKAGYVLARQSLLHWLDDLTGTPRKLGEILLQSGHVTKADLQYALTQQKPLGELLVEKGRLDRAVLDKALKKQAIMRVAHQQKAAAEPPAEQAAQAPMEIRVMRVDEDKIDALSNLIGELVVAKNTYDYLFRQLQNSAAMPSDLSKSLKDNLHLFSRLTAGLQQSLLSVRMIPIRGVFQKYARVVRDIARKQQKIIDFVTEGEDTEVDKKVADLLSEPLIHMVRNACDHGIETPDERRAAGKPEKGTVRLRAWQEGSRLYVQVRDDGKGINRQKVYEKALIRGFEVASPDDEHLLDLIFESGFSTKDEVTDVSGRGVGMDAVRSSVESLGGSIRLDSVEGMGSTITLELPMTMGITVSLVVRAKDKHYAIPLDNVVENIKVHPSAVRMFYDSKGISYRGEVLPVERLDTLLFDQQRSGDPRELFSEQPFSTFSLERDDEELCVVVLNTGRGKYGVVVDGVTRNVELAIRPVPDVLRDINVLSGVSILGDGKILLVLNPDNLV